MGWQDVKPSDDVQAAAWIGPRLHPFGSATVGSVVPTGFAAYVRSDTRDGLAPVLARHTSTPGRCWFCLWDGYGYLTGAIEVLTFWKQGKPPRRRPRIRPRRPKRQMSRVRLPSRDYLLFTGSVEEGAGWEDGPSLWWPQDNAWCVACEIDLDYALVGGTVELCDELVHICGAMRVRVDDSL